MFQLSQVELHSIRELLDAQRTAVSKYRHYAAISRDPQLRQVLTDCAGNHARQYQTLAQQVEAAAAATGIAGASPGYATMAPGFGGAGIGIAGGGGVGATAGFGGQTITQTAAQQGGSLLDDHTIASDALWTEKAIVDFACLSAVEAAAPQVRLVFQDTVRRTLENQDSIFRLMASRGWYQVPPPADPREVSRVRAHHNVAALTGVQAGYQQPWAQAGQPGYQAQGGQYGQTGWGQAGWGQTGQAGQTGYQAQAGQYGGQPGYQAQGGQYGQTGWGQTDR